MVDSDCRFCRLYRPIGALLLLLAILLLLMRACNAPATTPPVATAAPVVAAPAVDVVATVAPTVVPPTAVPPTAVPPTAVPPTEVPPTAAPPTAVSLRLPELALPAAADFTADGVTLSGTGEPGAIVEIREGTVRVDSAVVGADGRWTLLAELAEGAHQLVVRTMDDAGKVLNEAPALDVTVPAIALPEIKLPELALPAAADFTADGVALSGTGEPGATVEIREGTVRVGSAVVGADGRWTLLAELAEGAHQLVVRTVDAAGEILNEAPEVSVTVPQAQPEAETGEEIVLGAAYIVKAGDWLSTLAQAAYGDWRLYPLIVEATNAKAAEDATFATIDDSNLIEPGWKIWIPAKPAGN